MIKLLLLAAAGIATFSQTAFAEHNIVNSLTELKAICDDGLLTEQECASYRQEIMTRHKESAGAWFCNYAGDPTAPEPFDETDEFQYSEAAGASTIVKEILNAAGLAPNFIVRSSNVRNAAAVARFGERYIEYNPNFIAQLKTSASTNWSVYSVMAHEIGHHLQGHTLKPGGSRPDLELEADKYSGFILAKLGATLDEAQIAMNIFGSDVSNGTHPDKGSRLASIRNGWEEAKEEPTVVIDPKDIDAGADTGTTVPVVVLPPSRLAQQCTINGETVNIMSDGAVLSVPRGGLRVGTKVAPIDPRCVYDIADNFGGRYCVGHDRNVYYGMPQPVGRCS